MTLKKSKKKKKKKVSANLQSHLAFRWAWKGFAIKLKEGNFHINDLFDEAHLNDKKCCGKGSRFLLMKEVAVPHIVWWVFQRATSPRCRAGKHIDVIWLLSYETVHRLRFWVPTYRDMAFNFLDQQHCSCTSHYIQITDGYAWKILSWKYQ